MHLLEWGWNNRSEQNGRKLLCFSLIDSVACYVLCFVFSLCAQRWGRQSQCKAADRFVLLGLLYECAFPPCAFVLFSLCCVAVTRRKETTTTHSCLYSCRVESYKWNRFETCRCLENKVCICNMSLDDCWCFYDAKKKNKVFGRTSVTRLQFVELSRPWLWP